MVRITSAVLAIVLAGPAAAVGWRHLTIDGSSETNLAQSVAALKQKLSTYRGLLLDQALHEVWVQGTLDGIREGREFTSKDYLAQLDGLGFKAVLDLSDPTGEKMRAWQAAAHAEAYGRRPSGGQLYRSGPSSSSAFPPYVGGNGPTFDIGTTSPGGVWNSPEAVSARQGN